MDREFRIRGLAENTRTSYLEKMRCFVRHFMRPPDQLTTEDVKQYQLFLTKERQVTWGTLNVHVCAAPLRQRAAFHRSPPSGSARRRRCGSAPIDD